MRKLSTLRGLAILAVVLDHGALFTVFALSYWGFKVGRNVPTPDRGWVDSPWYVAELAIGQLMQFSVPLFLFASGFYVAYASRGKAENLSWHVVRGSLKSLLGPFVVWLAAGVGLSVLFVSLSGAAPRGTTLVGEAAQLLHGHPAGPLLTLMGTTARDRLGQLLDSYYYVPLLAAFLLTSRLLVSFALRRPRVLVVLTLLLQAGMSLPSILNDLGVGDAGRAGASYARLERILQGIGATHLGLTFFFVLGILVNQHHRVFQGWLSRYGRTLLVVTGLCAAWCIVEANATFHAAMLADPRRITPYDWSLPEFLYSTGLVLVLWDVEWRRGWVVRLADQLGIRSLAIYLMHGIAFQVVITGMYHAAPLLIGWPAALTLLLSVAGVALPSATIWIVSQSPARRYRRFLFGT